MPKVPFILECHVCILLNDVLMRPFPSTSQPQLLLQSFVRQLLRRCCVQGFATGNLRRREAGQLADYLEKLLKVNLNDVQAAIRRVQVTGTIFWNE